MTTDRHIEAVADALEVAVEALEKAKHQAMGTNNIIERKCLTVEIIQKALDKIEQIAKEVSDESN